MNRLLSALAPLAAAPLLVAGCATPLAQGPHSGPQGTITGVIQLPQGASADAICPGLQVVAADQAGHAFGESSVHASRNRCLYTLDYVGANVPLTVKVVANHVQACPTGAVAPATAPAVTLQRDETRELDITLHCA